jgi:UDP:flavonoid glycosyltransferase YjiC (YdhE family)
MMQAPHVLLALSGHGYGHLAQCAPVLNGLHARLPALRLTVMSELPQAVLAERLVPEFTHLPLATDPAIPMRSAWEVDAAATGAAFDIFHRDWDAALRADAERLQALAPDLLLANIPYRLLAAAAQTPIPAVALCSLNWAAILSAYAGVTPLTRPILDQVWAGYRAADLFLAPQPALPMPELDNYSAIGPIARRGRRDRQALRRELGVAPQTRVVLVALGGIDSRLPLAHWPRMQAVAWLFPTAPAAARDDCFDAGRLSQSFIDVLASADAVLTKPGYGTYAEAVCNAVPILTLARPDWPETPHLNTWARQHGCLEEISVAQFRSGAFASALERLWQRPLPEPPGPEGIQQAVDILSARL